MMIRRVNERLRDLIMMTVQCQHNARSVILTCNRLNWVKQRLQISLQKIGLTGGTINVVAGRVAGALTRF
jgi:hypothetical protein